MLEHSGIKRGDIGTRIQIVGNSNSGKSTTAERLAEILDFDLVELDRINWQPNWVALNETDPEEFSRRIQSATDGEGWGAAGSYSRFTRPVFWSRLHTVVWLDMPLDLLVRRVLVRSWRRWRSRELLWGTNYERFWPQLKLWNKQDSFLGGLLSVHFARRRKMLETIHGPAWSHIRFLRVRSVRDLESLLKSLESS